MAECRDIPSTGMYHIHNKKVSVMIDIRIIDVGYGYILVCLNIYFYMYVLQTRIVYPISLWYVYQQ